MKNELLHSKIAQIKRGLYSECKIIVRPSGTEDLLRVTLMSKNEKDVNLYLNELTNLIKEISK